MLPLDCLYSWAWILREHPKRGSVVTVSPRSGSHASFARCCAPTVVLGILVLWQAGCRGSTDEVRGGSHEALGIDAALPAAVGSAPHALSSSDSIDGAIAASMKKAPAETMAMSGATKKRMKPRTTCRRDNKEWKHTDAALRHHPEIGAIVACSPTDVATTPTGKKYRINKCEVACTGTVFKTSSTILTAAHCLEFFDEPSHTYLFHSGPAVGGKLRKITRASTVVRGLKLKDFDYWNKEDDESCFNRPEKCAPDDIAIGALDEPIVDVRPAQLATPSAKNIEYTIYGYGVPPGCDPMGGFGVCQFDKHSFGSKWNGLVANGLLLEKADSGGPVAINLDISEPVVKIVAVNSAIVNDKNRPKSFFASVSKHEQIINEIIAQFKNEAQIQRGRKRDYCEVPSYFGRFMTDQYFRTIRLELLEEQDDIAQFGPENANFARRIGHRNRARMQRLQEETDDIELDLNHWEDEHIGCGNAAIVRSNFTTFKNCVMQMAGNSPYSECDVSPPAPPVALNLPECKCAPCTSDPLTHPVASADDSGAPVPSSISDSGANVEPQAIESDSGNSD